MARLTNGTSEFGVQYDSLCDLISFGLAPAILMYQYALAEVGRIGWILCFFFLACGALRLARFNVQSSIGKTDGDFTGLPIPMAAGLIACFVGYMGDIDETESPYWLLEKAYEWASYEEFRQGFLIVMAPLLAILMVSNVRYRSHKSINIRGIQPFRLLAIIVGCLGIAAYKPTMMGFGFFFLYALSGLFELIAGWKKPADDSDIFASIEASQSMMEPVSSGHGGAEDTESKNEP